LQHYLDGKLLLKEKALGLKPIRVSLRQLVEEVPISKEVTSQVERWRGIIWSHMPRQKKEERH